MSPPQTPSTALDPNQNGDPTKKTYSKQPTGPAASTALAHSTPQDLILYGSCFCPFVHRIWIALEAKALAYQYVEVDVYRKPRLLLDINPRGLVPALRHGDWGCYESTVLLEYLEDVGEGRKLMPEDAKARARERLWADHVNRNVVPGFYRYLQAQEAAEQVKFREELLGFLETLLAASQGPGPFFSGAELGFVDVQIAPWVVRMRLVLKPYRGWEDPVPGTRWEEWVSAIERCEAVRKTTSEAQLYLDSYERYAENRPNTSEVREAVNGGRGLP